MPLYEWRGADEFQDNRNDRVIKPGETVELDEHVGGPQPYLVEVEEDDGEGGGSDNTEDVEPPFDPGEATIDELEAQLEDVPEDVSDAELDALHQAEKDGKERDGALNAIDAVRY